MKRRSLLAAAALALAACELAACENAIPMGTPSDDTAAKSFRPPAPGKGVVYVYQAGSGTVLDVMANQRVLGTLGGFSYLRTQMPPGRYELRARVNNADVALLPIDIRADEIRYVRATAGTQSYTLREEPANVAQPAIIGGKRVRDLQFLEVPP
jgi:hypothetical protein